MKTLRVTVQLCLLLCLLPGFVSLASASPLVLTGSSHFSALDGSAQDSDGLANGTFTVADDLVLDGTIHCNDAPPLLSNASACPIHISVAGNLTLEPGSEILAENRRTSGNGGNIRLEVAGDLTLRGADGSLPGALVSTGQTTGTIGDSGSLTAIVAGTVDLQAGSVLSASSKSGKAGAISVRGETLHVAGLVASGPSRTVAVPFPPSGAVLTGGAVGQAGGTIHLNALGSAGPGLRVETEAIVVSQGEGDGSRLVLLEACGIEVRGLVASLSRNKGPSQVVLRSGKGILVDGRDLGSAAPAEGRFGRVQADGTQQGAAGYLVDLFAESEIQIFGPELASGLFAVTSRPGDQNLRFAGGTITAISLGGTLTATGNAFETGRDKAGNKGGAVDLRARGDVTLDDAVARAVGGFSSSDYPNTRTGGHIDIRSYQGAVSWTFGVGDVRPTGTGVALARRGTIEITACTTVDTTGSQFPVNGSPVAPFPVETEGVCAPAAPSLPEGEPPLPTCEVANRPPVPTGGPFSVAENSANGTVVGTVLANDPDAGQSHTFSIVSGNTGGAFAINSSTGQITVADSAELDFEAIKSFTLTVEVLDNGTPALSGTVNVTINVTNSPEAPVANDEGSPGSPYVETVGNTLLEVAASPTLAGAKIHFNGNVLANDSDPDGPTAFTVVLESATAGAVVSLNPNGTFTYVPPPGFTGVDSFTYRITDPNGLSDTATVFINVEHRVWYVKNNAGADGLGRSIDPFDTLAEAEAASAAGDTIYLFAGNDTTQGQSDGIALKNGQRLIGESVPLAAPESVNINGVNGPILRSILGNRPKIENDDTPDAPGEDNGVSVPATGRDATGVEIRGLEIQGFDNAVDVTATGANNAGVTIRNNVITGARLEGIDVNAGSTGTVTLSIHDNSLTTTGTAIDVQRAAGTVYITGFQNNSVSGNTAGTGVNILGVIFDSVPGGAFDPVSGGVTVIGAPGNGVGQAGMVLTSLQGSLSFLDLDIFADGGAGLRVSGTGSGMTFGVLPGAGIIEATGGPAVDISQASIALPLSSIKSTNSPTTGLALSHVTGNFSAGSESSISNITSVAGTAFQVGSSNATIGYAGTISTTQGKGVDLTGNTGSTIALTGTLTLSTGPNTAFNATGGGTVVAPSTANTLASTTGTALNVANTTIGSDGLKFRSISVNGAPNGIVLNGTGTSGGLTISGSGSAGSGGTIQNTTNRGASFIDAAGVELNWMTFTNAATTNGADPTSASSTCGDLNVGGNLGCNASIHLANVSGIGGNPAAKLNRLTINGSAQVGINLNNVNGLELTNTTLTGIGNQVREFGLKGRNLLGAVTISGLSISGSFGENFRVENNTGMTTATVTGSTFSSSTQGGGFFHIAQGSAQTDVDVSTSSFTGNFTTGLLVGVSDPVATGSANLDVTGGPFTTNNAGIQVIGAGGADVTFNIHDISNISGNPAGGIALDLSDTSTAAGSLIGRIANNMVTMPATGSGNGIGVMARGAGTTTVQVTGNTVTNRSQYGIHLHRKEGVGGTLNATVTGNTVTTVDVAADTQFPIDGIRVEAGAASGDTGTLCAHIASNTATGANSVPAESPGDDIRLRHRFGITFRLPGLSGSTSTDADNHVTGLNPGATLVSATTTTSFTGGAACPTPP